MAADGECLVKGAWQLIGGLASHGYSKIGNDSGRGHDESADLLVWYVRRSFIEGILQVFVEIHKQ